MLDETGGGGGLMQADAAALTSAAMEAGTTAEALDLMLSNLMDNLSGLLIAWTGEGGTAFQNVRSRVEEQMRNLNRSLTFLGERVGLSSSDYVGEDELVREEMVAAGAFDESVTRLSDSDTTEVQRLVEGGGATESRITAAMNSPE